MNRRDAIQTMGGGLAAIFLGACSESTKILSPISGTSNGQLDGASQGARRTSRVGHTIFVTVENTSIRVEPETLVMTSRDDVRFVPTNGRGFSIVFEQVSPFQKLRLPFAEAKSRLSPLGKGRFKYTIVSDDNPNLILDPVIIVEDPPTNPKP